MKIGKLSDKGIIRVTNEDKVYSSRNKDIFIIADGMGGHKGGKIASKIAINKVRDYIKSRLPENEKSHNMMLKLVHDAIQYANEKIYKLSNEDDNVRGMGTTIIAGIFYDNIVYLGHVGDSRVYYINNKIIKQITKDHSLVQELLDMGKITKKEVINHPNKSIITRALGINKKTKIDTHKLRLYDGDTLLLCTDGLTNMLKEREILEIIKNNISPRKCAKILIDKANELGGTDNVSVIIARNIS